MAIWSFLLLLSIFLFPVLLFFLGPRTHGSDKLPPSPPPVPLLGNLLWLTKPFSSLEPVLRRLRAAYGPVVTIFIGHHPAIFVMDRAHAHESLVQKGTAFAHRPPPLGTSRALSSNLHSVNMADYGPLWRGLRRGLSSEVFNPSGLGLHAEARRWALDAAVNELKSRALQGGGVVAPAKSLQFALFRVFSLLCFGDKVEDEMLGTIRAVQLDLLKLAVKLSVFNLLPKIVMVIFLRRYTKMLEIRQKQDKLIIPLIQARRSRHQDQHHDLAPKSYLDVLLELKNVEQGGRNLDDEEIVSLCSEFLNASTETTSTALEWIMANLVKHQSIQEKLSEEIKSVIGAKEEAIVRENDIRRMPYLRAVVLEGLRRHPPAHFLLPHTVKEDTLLGKFVIPRGATINYSVAEMGWDPELWSDPLDYRPERFLPGGEGEGVDLMGSKEIKMMPFGAGKRLCPGLGIALLLLEYFVANLIREFRWKEVAGEEVDLSEEPGLVSVMKIPFRARLVAREIS